jgi:hypothetical protein
MLIFEFVHKLNKPYIMKLNTEHRRHLDANAKKRKFLTNLFIASVTCMLFMIMPSLSFGQSSGWTKQSNVGDVNAYAKIDSCSGEPAKTFFIKFENTSSSDAYEIAYELSVPDAMTFPPVKGKITVAAAKSVEGDCKKLPLQGLRMPIEANLNSFSDLTIKYTITKL